MYGKKPRVLNARAYQQMYFRIILGFRKDIKETLSKKYLVPSIHFLQ